MTKRRTNPRYNDFNTSKNEMQATTTRIHTHTHTMNQRSCAGSETTILYTTTRNNNDDDDDNDKNEVN